MPKYFDYVFLLLTFIVGITIGLYSGTNFTDNIAEASEGRIARTVQDAVIAKIQAEYNLEKVAAKGSNEGATNSLNMVKVTLDEDDFGEDSNDVIPVSVSVTKLSTSAEMVIKKNFTKCNHSKVERMDIPRELVNYTEDEVKEKYKGWIVEKFDADEMILSKDIEANCDDHYVIKEVDGKVALYKEFDEDKMNFVKFMDIEISLLSEVERKKFDEGIRLYGNEELSSFEEDYMS